MENLPKVTSNPWQPTTYTIQKLGIASLQPIAMRAKLWLFSNVA